MSDPSGSDRARLQALAVRVMRERGLDPDFPADVLADVARMNERDAIDRQAPRDLRSLPGCSIDNDHSRDLDQLTVGETRAGGDVRVRVAIADVDALVAQGSAVDRHAGVNTTSVYTPAVIFPMLPERLSTDLTSLNGGEDRTAVVVDMTVGPDGELRQEDVYSALVHNHAKLTYRGVGAWLGGHAAPPDVAGAPGLADALTLQDRVSQALSGRRHEQGALDLDDAEASAEFDGDTLRDLRVDEPNRARALIENLMIAANGVTARFLDRRQLPSIRRVVRAPKRWGRIVALAAAAGGRLPEAPDARALAAFLRDRRHASPDTFADLSLSVVKLLGPGEYAVDRPGQDPPGHFGLAVRDYTHATAPNRRYPDLLTQRLVKAALADQGSPYPIGALERLATHCTIQEDAANKVERQLRKSAAALVVSSRIGATFDAIVTGASPKGTFVRVVTPPVDGMLVRGAQDLDVGDRLHVRLQHTDVDRGFIDFVRA
jgi:exoribonuclease-2